MFADRAEALHCDPRALEIEADEAARHVDRGGEPKSGCADLVERNAADGTREADRAACVSSLIYPMHSSSVPMSGPGT